MYGFKMKEILCKTLHHFCTDKTFFKKSSNFEEVYLDNRKGIRFIPVLFQEGI